MNENDILAMTAGPEKFEMIMNLEDKKIRYAILSVMKDPEHLQYCAYWLSRHKSRFSQIANQKKILAERLGK